MLKRFALFAFIGLLFVPKLSANNPDQYFNGMSVSSTEPNHNPMICMDVKPQHSVDIDQIMGLWYGSEIIIHTQDVPGVYEYDTCVIIHLTDVTEKILMHQARDYDLYNNNNNNGNGNNNNNQRYGNRGRQFTPTTYTYDADGMQQPQPQQQQHQQPWQSRQPYGEREPLKYLRLVWSEKDNNLEYTFNYTAHAPGLWSNLGDQRGSLVQLNQYTQFKGTVQVVKAVSDHLVLTFCGNDIKSSIYTIVLTRNRLGLSADEIRSIRNLLSRRGLHTETIRKVCSAAMAHSPWRVAFCAIVACLALAWRKFY